MSDEDWVKAAMTDDSVVVELLVRLHQATQPPPSKANDAHPAKPPLEWSVRQPRSKPILHGKPKPTASPTTPLSWSGGATSISGGATAAAADGYEESSRPPPPKLVDATRSKVGKTNHKKTGKKKTLTELKEEETFLVKERRHLKRELATLRVTLEKQRAANESLKRLKLNVESQPAVKRVTTVVESSEAVPDQTQQNIASFDAMPPISSPEARTNDHDSKQQPPTPKGSFHLHQELINQDNKFVLPDLNLPLDEDTNS